MAFTVPSVAATEMVLLKIPLSVAHNSNPSDAAISMLPWMYSPKTLIASAVDGPLSSWYSNVNDAGDNVICPGTSVMSPSCATRICTVLKQLMTPMTLTLFPSEISLNAGTL